MNCYELFITNICTRSCRFCDINKGTYIASLNDADQFILYVKQHETITSKFQILFFGGEPLLCKTIIYYIYNAFTCYTNCTFKLTTNADLIDNFNFSFFSPHNFSITISAYDIFKNPSKYLDLYHAYKSFILKFQYTFDELNINNIDKFINICTKLKIPYNIRFSHSKQSWLTISEEKLITIIKHTYMHELMLFYNSTHFNIPYTIFQKLYRYVLYLFNDKQQSLFCVSKHKKTFFNGKNIGSCIRLVNKQHIYPNRCRSCEYELCCLKGCSAEYVNNDINKKLCLIEKCPFDVISSFIYDHQYDYRMQQILSYIISINYV